MTAPDDNFAAVLSRLDLDALAERLSTTITDYGYAEAGLDVIAEAIRPALPAFVTACLVNQAHMDDALEHQPAPNAASPADLK